MGTFHHYKEWECFLNGMYRVPEAENIKSNIIEAKNILSDIDELRRLMNMVVDNWPNSSSNFLMNPSSKGRSWLGQAACNIENKISEFSTRKAWVLLNCQQQKKANDCAESVIINYKSSLSSQLKLF